MEWPATLVIAQAIREILLSIALLIGGGWAVYRYWYLERKEVQLEMKQAESQFGLTSYLNIAIEHLLQERDGAFDLIGDVRISNPGTKGIRFDLTTIDPIRISKVALGPAGQYEIAGEPLLLGLIASETVEDCQLEGEGSASLKFVARLHGPQIYLIEFWSRIAQTGIGADEHFTSWMGSKIVDVSAEAIAAVKPAATA